MGERLSEKEENDFRGYRKNRQNPTEMCYDTSVGKNSCADMVHPVER